MRLYMIYSAGNFIECGQDAPFLQIGEHKYGKPILDRAVKFTTDIYDALKIGLISMDSTMRSNLGVGLPIDIAVIRRDALDHRGRPPDRGRRALFPRPARALVGGAEGRPHGDSAPSLRHEPVTNPRNPLARPAGAEWALRSRLRVGMSRLSLLARPAPGALVLRIVWPLAVLFAATLTVVFGTIYGSAGEDALDELGPVLLSGVAATLIFLAVLAVALRWILHDLAASQERAQLLAGRDPLSSLPNRLLFTERLDMEIGRLGRTEGSIAVMFLDLDRFKDVNDTYGHPAGDELIKQVAQRLSDLLRGADTLARFGGDEFAIIQTGLRSSADAEALARRILDSISRPFDIAGAQVSVGVSIGVALAPQNGESHDVLMRLADTALYQAKSEGRNRFSFFERTMDDALRMRKVVEDDLRHAILRDELALHYQPVYSADGGSIVGVEALVRWPHAKHGLISPSRFIALAEERGLVIPLGEWVLRRACEDGKRWPHLRMAVNVSPLQFRHRDFVASVVRTLRETGFDPTRLELELTEGVVVEDADAAEAAMMELRALGVNLALDDFGTGYSSLIYLRRFAFDKIKIDRSFLESMEATGESAILVHSIVHLGRALGLTVTAEGVETKRAAPVPPGARLPSAPGLPVLEGRTPRGDRPSARRAGRGPGRLTAGAYRSVSSPATRAYTKLAFRVRPIEPSASPPSTTSPSRSTRPRPTRHTATPRGIWPRKGGSARTIPIDSSRISTPVARNATPLSKIGIRGREKRSRRRRIGIARATARSTSVRAMERRSSARGSQGVARPKMICTATSARRRPQTSGIGGGIGRQFGRPRRTTSSAKARSRRTPMISATVSRSPEPRCKRSENMGCTRFGTRSPDGLSWRRGRTSTRDDPRGQDRPSPPSRGATPPRRVPGPGPRR